MTIVIDSIPLNPMQIHMTWDFDNFNVWIYNVFQWDKWLIFNLVQLGSIFSDPTLISRCPGPPWLYPPCCYIFRTTFWPLKKKKKKINLCGFSLGRRKNSTFYVLNKPKKHVIFHVFTCFSAYSTRNFQLNMGNRI